MITLVLRHRFIFAPILLSSVTKHFSGLEHTFRFYQLVDEYLPDEKKALLTMPLTEASGKFVQLFSMRYFPLNLEPSWGQVGLDTARLIGSIPRKGYALQSFDYDVGRDIAPGRLLASVICVSPFNDAGARLSLVDRFIRQAGGNPELLPKQGHGIELVEAALIDSPLVVSGAAPYPGLLAWCRWLFARTGNPWLDKTHGSEPWSRENVANLTAGWIAYLEMNKQMQEFNTWLKKDFTARSTEVLRYIGTKITHRPKTLMAILSGGNNGSV